MRSEILRQNTIVVKQIGFMDIPDATLKYSG